jgi:lysozyme
MTRPNITQAEFAAYVKAAATSITNSINEYVASGRMSKEEGDRYLLTATAAHNDPVMVLAIRGYFKNSMGAAGQNDRGIYDDAMVLSGPNYLQTFNANTDPRIYDKGKAMLLPGWHLFKPGLHHPGKPGQHEAFRTANDLEQLPVLRDGMFGIKWGQYINLHKGGIVSTNSAGCQTVQEGEWLEFQRNAYGLLKKEGQRILPYLLIENN